MNKQIFWHLKIFQLKVCVSTEAHFLFEFHIKLKAKQIMVIFRNDSTEMRMVYFLSRHLQSIEQK